MAGECPHSTLLETTLQQCNDGPSSSLMARVHESYLKIIDDLKKDLEEISCEVIMVQKECNDQDQSYETSDAGLEVTLRELETQNDRLEQALKLQTQTEEAALTELQTNNETLKCQITHLQHQILERDKHIMQLCSKLKNISNQPRQAALEYVNSRNNFSIELEKKIKILSEKLEKSTRQEHFLHIETRKLNEELNESRQKNGDFIAQAHRLSNLLKCQETHRLDLAEKYEALEQNYEEQAKKLRDANYQLSILDEKFQIMEKRQIEHNTERTYLREEVLSLKEKHACAIGCQKGIHEQLINTQRELFTAHDVIKEQEAIMQRIESGHTEHQRRLQEANAELKKKLSDLAKDYQKLQEEYENQKEINSEQLKLLDNFRKWKEAQLTVEQNTRDGFKKYQVYTNEVLKEKQEVLIRYHDLSKEYSQLQIELDRLKLCSFSFPPLNVILNSSERSIAERLEIVRRTTHRVSEHSSSFKGEEQTASRGDSSSAYRPSEEPL